jgi:hypothetical protein
LPPERRFERDCMRFLREGFGEVSREGDEESDPSAARSHFSGRRDVNQKVVLYERRRRSGLRVRRVKRWWKG